jgi:hypothetical protein
MAQFIITISGKRLRQSMVQKLVDAFKEKGTDSVSVRKVKVASSRADRWAEAVGMVETAKGDMEGLKDELQDWYDNLPENFQNGDKGQQLEEAMSQIDEAISGCEIAEGVTVDFPGMY